MPTEKQDLRALNLVKLGAVVPTLEGRAAAEILLSHVLGVKRKDIYLANSIAKNQKEAFLRLISQRVKSQKPIAYLIGTQEFMGLTFKVAPKATLIPRPETEMLVELALRETQKKFIKGLPLRILDIGTGCGCIGLSLWQFLHESYNIRLILTDISNRALKIARANARGLGIPKDRVSLVRGTWPATHQKFHLIVSNPPYINTAEYLKLPKEIHDWEPREALLGGADGLDLIREIIVGSKTKLAPKGMMALEIDPRQAIKIKQLVLKNGYKEVGIVKDLENRDRIIHGRL